MRHTIHQEITDVNVKVGDDIVVHLPELATAGYEWHMSDVLPAGLRAFTVPVTEDWPMAIGGKSLHAFGLQVNAPGQFLVRWSCYRSWEGPSSAAETYTLTVNAHA